MIRVLHIVDLMDRGGQETLLMNIYREINRDRVQFDFAVSTNMKGAYDDEIISLGGKIYQLPAMRKKTIRRFYMLHRLVRQNKYIIVHRHSDKSVQWTDMAAALTGGAKIRIYHSHNTLSKDRILHLLCRPINNMLSTHKLACSKQAGNWMYGKQMIDTGMVTVNLNAINTDKFKFDKETRKRVRRDLNLQDKLVIGHVGRFDAVKNHEFLIEVFAQVHKKYPNTILLLIGDGILRPDIERRVKMLGLSSKVSFLGLRDDVHELYQGIDVFTMPSVHEGFSVALMEALTAGLPCVITANMPNASADGLEHIFRQRVIQLQLENNCTEWAEAIVQASLTDRDINAHNTIKQAGLDIKNSAAIYCQMYDNLLC